MVEEEKSQENTARSKNRRSKKHKKHSHKNKLARTLKVETKTKKQNVKMHVQQKTFDHFAPLPGVTFTENGKVKKG